MAQFANHLSLSARSSMFYYWVEMHYACPRGHGNLSQPILQSG